jgi:hypothetical protein
VRSYEGDPQSGAVRVEFFPEQSEHEVIIGEQPTVVPKPGVKVPGYDQLFNGNFPKFKSASRG